MCTGEAPGAALTLLEAVRSGQVEAHAACSLRRLARANSLRWGPAVSANRRACASRSVHSWYTAALAIPTDPRPNSLHTQHRVALPGPVDGFTSVSSDLLAVGPQAFKLHTLAHSCAGWVLATAQLAVLRCEAAAAVRAPFCGRPLAAPAAKRALCTALRPAWLTSVWRCTPLQLL